VISMICPTSLIIPVNIQALNLASNHEDIPVLAPARHFQRNPQYDRERARMKFFCGKV
jgi:hypothetical protein